MAKDMFDPGANASPTLVRVLLGGRQWLVPICFMLNLGTEVPLLELAFNLLRPIGRIAPHLLPRGLGLQEVFEDLPVMDRCIRDRIRACQYNCVSDCELLSCWHPIS